MTAGFHCKGWLQCTVNSGWQLCVLDMSSCKSSFNCQQLSFLEIKKDPPDLNVLSDASPYMTYGSKWIITPYCTIEVWMLSVSFSTRKVLMKQVLSRDKKSSGAVLRSCFFYRAKSVAWQESTCSDISEDPGLNRDHYNSRWKPR